MDAKIDNQNGMPWMNNVLAAKPAGKPLWQWGLIAAGAAVIGYIFWKAATEKTAPVHGYRQLLSDTNPKSKASARTVEGKCTRVPSEAKLKDAEVLEVA